MKRLAVALALFGTVAFTPANAADDTPTGVVKAFLAAFSKADVAAAKATHDAGTVSIMDEVPPHVWQGEGAFDAWLASLSAYDTAHGRAGGVVVATAPPRVATTEGDRGYVVVPVAYTFTEHGHAMREAATMTFALHRGAAGWKIAGWSWNGTVPRRVGK